MYLRNRFNLFSSRGIEGKLSLPLLLLMLLCSAGCSSPNVKSPTSAQSSVKNLYTAAGTELFDSKRAWNHLLRQCAFGPRPVGTDAHKKTRDYLYTEMKLAADVATIQDFTYRKMQLSNIIGVINPDAKRKVLLCAHWDTRPTADEEVDPVKQRQPIMGANDGASGVAVLLELARVFHAKRPRVGVILVLFDGEDYGDFRKDEGVFLGSKYFAAHHAGYTPEYGILIDMIGDKNLDIYREVNSQNFAPGTNEKVFRIAGEMGYRAKFIDDVKYDLSDDHIPLNRARIPTIDLIDFSYGPWHTLDDTPDKCSKDSLNIIGRTLAEVIYREIE